MRTWAAALGPPHSRLLCEDLKSLAKVRELGLARIAALREVRRRDGLGAHAVRALGEVAVGGGAGR